MLEFLDDFELPAKIYSLVTAVCLILDMISCFVFVIMTGQPENKILHGSQLFIVTFYFYLDLMYVSYLGHLCLRLPTENNIRKYFPKALAGLGDEMRIAFGQAPVVKKPARTKPPLN